MDTNVVLDAVRRSNRLMLMWGAFFVIAVAAGIYLDQRQLISFFSGPRELATQELMQIDNADAVTNYWVTVKGSDLIDTGWQTYTEDDFGSQTIDSSYAALAVGSRYLLVQIPNQIDVKSLPLKFSGALTNLPDDVTSQVIPDIRSQNARMAAAILPVMLDTSDFRPGAYARIAVIALGAILALVLLNLSVRRTLDPLRHPFMKALARYGDPQTLSEAISVEMALNHTQIGKGIHLTRRWLIVQRGGGFQAAQLDAVVWIFQKVTQHRTYGIKTRKTFAAEVWDQTGKLITFMGSQNDVSAGLQAIVQAAPGAVVGYTKELDQQWRKQRDQFLENVRQRRKEIDARRD